MKVLKHRDPVREGQHGSAKDFRADSSAGAAAGASMVLVHSTHLSFFTDLNSQLGENHLK